jgi:hypothetical protein
VVEFPHLYQDLDQGIFVRNIGGVYGFHSKI